MKIFPTTDRVAVVSIPQEESFGGMEIVREGRNTEMQFGKIVASGPQSPIEEGELVLFNPAAGTLIRRPKGDGSWEEVRIMHSDTIQAVYV